MIDTPFHPTHSRKGGGSPVQLLHFADDPVSRTATFSKAVYCNMDGEVFVTDTTDFHERFAALPAPTANAAFLHVLPTLLHYIAENTHRINVEAGWWHDPFTGQPLKRNVGEILCLVHSEISEAMEGHRKSLPDDKLPHRPMFSVEIADALIRLFDIAGAGHALCPENEDVAGATAEKIAFNLKREDHKRENRILPGGKKF